ncbi:MAG: hypothetical protein HN368_05800, partial [Spirochaetales bacterium]|nr:hypothetical protein [Spirochaetales bacterium]
NTSGSDSLLLPLPHEFAGTELYHEEGGGFGYSDGVLVIKDRDGTVTKISNGGTNGYVHNVYGFSDSGLIVTGGFNGALTVYNKSGEYLTRLLGHSGTITALACDGDLLISAAEDQIIRFWDLKGVESPGSGLSTKRPSLNLFIAEDNEWVLWSGDGYYYSSVRGDSYIGYHINQGTDKQALYYPSDRFYKALYNPEYIKGIAADLTAPAGAVRRGIAALPSIGITDILPPVVTVLFSKNRMRSDGEFLNVDFTVASNSPIHEVKILLNGRPFWQHSPAATTDFNLRFNQQIPLHEPTNVIAIISAGEYASGAPVLISADRSTNAAEKPPDLYVLSIGISSHMDSKFELEFADDDAIALVNLFEEQNGITFSRVHTKLLTNRMATRQGILESFSWLLSQDMARRDTVVVFIAGHGLNGLDGNYYFVSYDTVSGKLSESAVQWAQFSNLLKNLPGQVLLMADTCHSGNLIGEFSHVIKENYTEGFGHIVFAAATGDLPSYEHQDWGHGAFTKAFLDGVASGSADLNNDGSVSVFEIGRILPNSVKKLTRNRQIPTIIIPDTTPDFKILNTGG